MAQGKSFPPSTGEKSNDIRVSVTQQHRSSIDAIEIARTTSRITETIGDVVSAAIEPATQHAEPPEMSSLRRTTMAVLVLVCQNVQMVMNFAGMAGGLDLGKLLGASPTTAVWIAASYAMTQGAFVLVAGPIGAVYGHKNMLIYGLACLGCCTVACGFVNNFAAFVALRALSGIGGAMIMPNAVAILTITYPPGPSRNLLLGFFGASAPFGGWFGATLIGLFLQFSEYKWFYLMMFLVCVMLAVALQFLIPREVPPNQGGSIDWTGACVIVSALILFNFSFNQAPSSGWSNPAVIVCFIASLVCLGTFLAWEYYVASAPIMPLSIFKAPSFGMLILVVLLNFMSVGIFCWYQVLWLQELWGWSVLQFAISWVPFVLCAIAAASLAAWLVPRLAAQWILAIGILTVLGALLLMATLSEPRIYWPQVFPAVVLFAFSPDLVYTASQIIASNSVSRRHQGTAGSLISVLNLYGNSLGLGFAGTIEVNIGNHGQDLVKGYRGAMYFGIGLAVLALVIDVIFIRSPKDTKSGWDGSDTASEDGHELEGTRVSETA